MGDFLQSFETVFEEIQQELDAIPQLFSLTPTPFLAVEVTEADLADPQQTLHLDSAAGLYPGDVIQLESGDNNPNSVEFAVIESVSPALLPQTITLTQSLRFPHPKGTPVRVIEPSGPRARLSRPVSREGQTTITVVEAPDLRVTQGDVLRLEGNDGAAEYALVVGVGGVAISLTPALQNRYEAGQPVTFLRLSPTATPPATFSQADRQGAEFFLQTTAMAGESFLELDTLIGLMPGDILHLQESDPAKVEFIKVKALPPEPSEDDVAILRFAIALTQPLAYSHDTGLGINVLRPTTEIDQLAQPLSVGASTLTLENPEALEAAVGTVLQVDEGARAEYVQVLLGTDSVLTIAPVPNQIHPVGCPVRRMETSGSGTLFLNWLGNWIGVRLRPDRGERWNRELLRTSGRLLPWRGTKAGIEAALKTYLRGEVQQVNIFDTANPLQIGLVSTVGVDTVINGNPLYYFWVNLVTNRRNSQTYSATGLRYLIQVAQQTIQQEKPAHTDYALRVQTHPMQIGVDPMVEIGARVGRTTLLGGELLTIQDELTSEEEAG